MFTTNGIAKDVSTLEIDSILMLVQDGFRTDLQAARPRCFLCCIGRKDVAVVLNQH